MSTKNLITILVVVVLAIGVYWLLTSYKQPTSYKKPTGDLRLQAEQQSLSNVDFFLDNSVASEVNSSLAEVAL